MLQQQPALDPAGDGPGKARPVASDREAMCRMLDGTWQAVKVLTWQQLDGGRWRCMLQWGVWGHRVRGRLHLRP